MKESYKKRVFKTHDFIQYLLDTTNGIDIFQRQIDSFEKTKCNLQSSNTFINEWIQCIQQNPLCPNRIYMINTFGVDICEHLMYAETIPQITEDNRYSLKSLCPRIPPPMPLAVPRPFTISFRDKLTSSNLFRLKETNEEWNVSNKTLSRITKKKSLTKQKEMHDSENGQPVVNENISNSLTDHNGDIIFETFSSIIISSCDYLIIGQNHPNIEKIIMQIFNILSNYFTSVTGKDIYLKDPNADINKIRSECLDKLNKASPIIDDSPLLNVIKEFIYTNYTLQTKGRLSQMSLKNEDIDKYF